MVTRPGQARRRVRALSQPLTPLAWPAQDLFPGGKTVFGGPGRLAALPAFRLRDLPAGSPPTPCSTAFGPRAEGSTQ